MRAVRLIVMTGIIAGLLGVLPASAAAPSWSIGIRSVAACKDSLTVAVSGSSTYSKNRLDVGVYYREQGNWKLLQQVFTPQFGAGPFSLAVPLQYRDNAATAGETLRVDVQLQRSSGDTYVDVGSFVTTHVVVADRDCIGKCNLTVTSSDKAPASGTITVRTHFGALFRPEGRLYGAAQASAGQPLQATFVGLPCKWAARVWYYPRTGDKTPRLLPAQYWPNEFQVNALDISNPYTTAFARGLKATQPVEVDDPYASK